MKDLERLAELIRQRNATEVAITRIVGRPAQIGHVGEYIAAKVFRIALRSSASAAGYDGHFEDGPLQGRTVNIKWYARNESVLDIEPSRLPDDFLVLTGPWGIASKGTPRPWAITSVFLFDAHDLTEELRARGVKVGVASGVRRALWDAAEIYPKQRNTRRVLSEEQRRLLSLFAAPG